MFSYLRAMTEINIADHMDFLYGQARRYPAHLQDDLVQETAYRILKRKDKIDTEGRFKGYLVMTMRNIFINGTRRGKRVFYVDEVHEYGDTIDLCSTNKGGSVVDAELIHKAIERLPEQMIESFKLFCEGFTYDEIVKKIGVSRGTIASRIHHARKILHEMDDIKEFRSGGKLNSSGLKVLVIDQETGERQEFKSQREASRILKIPIGNINHVLSGRRNHAHNKIFKLVS